MGRRRRRRPLPRCLAATDRALTSRVFAERIWTALGGDTAIGPWHESGEGDLPSVFAVSDLAAGAVGAAALGLSELLAGAPVALDRRAASLWFKASFQPVSWEAPPTWDAIAGDYPAADGWIRLHTNAVRHRAAALAVLGVPAERPAVAAAVATWPADALEHAVVERGGCAAAMRSMAAWAAHPQGMAVAAEKLAHVDTSNAGPRWRVADDRRPLAGLRVLDLTRILAGPVATRFLAGFGATVLRIDPPDWEEPSLEPEVTLGKHCARLDLRTARDALLALLRDADVVVHGYRPGALDRLGLDAATRRQARPGLIDVSLDAYGWSGPWAGRRGFDSLVQMSTGIARAGMERLGRDRPTPLPAQALDHATGYMMAAAVLRGLAIGGMRARFSLARTASLLCSVDAAAPRPAIGAPGADDFSPAIETTVWGEMRRLRPPVSVGPAHMRWDRPAGRLGASPPEWP